MGARWRYIFHHLFGIYSVYCVSWSIVLEQYSFLHLSCDVYQCDKFVVSYEIKPFSSAMSLIRFIVLLSFSEISLLGLEI